MSRRPRRPSPALAIACLALGVALGGTSYAAVRIPAKSVGREQLRNGSVGLSTLRANSVDATKVVNGSLRSADFGKGVLPGPETSTIRKVSGDPVAAGAVGSATAACQAGERLMGGGGGFAGPPTTNDVLSESIPVGDAGTQWRTSLKNGGVSPRTPVAYAICATG